METSESINNNKKRRNSFSRLWSACLLCCPAVVAVESFTLKLVGTQTRYKYKTRYKASMCKVMVSGRCGLWLSVGTLALVLQLMAILSAEWLLVPPPVGGEGTNYTPSVGVIIRCTQLDWSGHCISYALDSLSTDPTVYPTAWKFAFVFLMICVTIHSVTLVVGVLSCCVRAVCRKSVVSLAGAAQSFAGVMGIIGFLLHPWGWGSQRVLAMCGETSEPFLPANCSFGWGLYACMAGISLTFAASALSRLADRAAESNSLRRHMDQGKRLICVV